MDEKRYKLEHTEFLYFGPEDEDEYERREREILNNPDWLNGADETEEEYWDHTELD